MLPILPYLGSKALLLFITALSVHVSLSPPNPPVKKEDRIYFVQKLGLGSKTRTISNPRNSPIIGITSPFEKVVLWVTFFSKLMIWAGVFLNILALAAVGCSSGNTSLAAAFLGSIYHRCPAKSDVKLHGLPLESVGVHPALVVGTISTIVAAVLRVWCFKTLGPFFTFEITIRPKHHLITDGPYAWVRHPSYTGVYLTLFGASLSLWSPETLNVECASQTADWTSLGPIWHTWQRTFGMAFAGVWVAKCLFACHGMTTRMEKEDNVLEATFRECWEEYAERVPWKLIPGIW